MMPTGAPGDSLTHPERVTVVKAFIGRDTFVFVFAESGEAHAFADSLEYDYEIEDQPVYATSVEASDAWLMVP